MAFFMEECPNAYDRWSTRALPTAVTYQGLLQQKKQNHKSLRKNVAYAGIPWRMCSAFYLAVMPLHGLSTYSDITMLSRSYSLKSLDL